jgi:hypothetical protein
MLGQAPRELPWRNGSWLDLEAVGRLARLGDGGHRDRVPRATFPCPLCRDVGRVVTLEAKLEPEPPLVIVTDLHGGCAHAAAFGELEGQTIEDAWTLIEAALDAASGD